MPIRYVDVPSVHRSRYTTLYLSPVPCDDKDDTRQRMYTVYPERRVVIHEGWEEMQHAYLHEYSVTNHRCVKWRKLEIKHAD